MRKRSLVLLCIFLVGLVPFSPVRAEGEIKRDLDDAVSFLYLSDAILLPEGELDLEEASMGLLAPVFVGTVDEVDIKPLLARIIHSKKMTRNDLDANCKLLKARLKAEGRDCDLKKVDQYCQSERAEINLLIKYYRNKRGDQRKFFTKVWHNIKRNARNFWHRIGPVGRKFLRNMGDEAFQMAISGGLSGATFKNLVKHTVKSMGRQKIREIVYQGVGRMLQGQINILTAAGVDICDEEEEVTTTEDENGQGDCTSDGRWLDEYWDDVVIPRLVEDVKNCQPKAAGAFRTCLQEQAYAGACPDDAADACYAHYESIPKNDSGGSVSLSPTIFHGGAESVSTSLTYSSGGGAVTGQFFFTIYDSVNVCTITVSSTVVGNYDQFACSMSGTAQLEAIYEGYACPSVCGPSTGACPKTFQSEVPWDATLKDGELFGGVGGEIYVEGSFGFSSSP